MWVIYGGCKENKEVPALTNHLGMPANRNEPLTEYDDAKAKKSHWKTVQYIMWNLTTY